MVYAGKIQFGEKVKPTKFFQYFSTLNSRELVVKPFVVWDSTEVQFGSVVRINAYKICGQLRGYTITHVGMAGNRTNSMRFN